jgi:hypothetical protein
LLGSESFGAALRVNAARKIRGRRLLVNMVIIISESGGLFASRSAAEAACSFL